MESANDQPLLRTIGEIRVATERLRRRGQQHLVIGAVVIVVLAFAATFPFRAELSDPLLAIISSALIPCALLYQFMNYRYRKRAEALFKEKLSAALGLTHRMGGEGGLTLADAVPHKILPATKEEHHDESFAGEYKGFSLAFQDVALGSAFEGFMIRIAFPRPLTGHTVIIPSSLLRSALQGRFEGMSAVPLNNARLEKGHTILSSDTVEARLLVNNAFATLFLDNAKALKAGWAAASFMSNELLVLIRTGQPFYQAPPLWKAIKADTFADEYLFLDSLFRLTETLRHNKQMAA